jgi:hypothetical protein
MIETGDYFPMCRFAASSFSSVKTFLEAWVVNYYGVGWGGFRWVGVLMGGLI